MFMKQVSILLIATVVILIGLACPLALGQANRTANVWDFEFTPYLWMPELDADAQLGGLSGSAETSSFLATDTSRVLSGSRI